MSHEIGGMPMMKNPSQCLCKHISRIHDSREMDQDNVLHKSPVLECKIPDLYMTRVISGSTVIDNLDCRVIVFIDGCRLSLSVSQLMKNET